jgi:16S rRNA G966 N2-methylase RsmD
MNTREFIEKFQQADVNSLALQAGKYPEVDMPFALDQIEGRQTALTKIPSYSKKNGILYPHHLSMEQCSSELTALYKAHVVEINSSSSERNTFTDLTAGFGVDFSFIAPLFKKATYVEQQEYLCELARNNFPLLNLSHAQILNANCLNYLEQMNSVDWIFLDPARRDKHGSKVVSIADCEPNVEALEPLLLQKGKKILVKLSPMLDITLALHTLKHIHEVHVVAVNNECKELLFILKQGTISTDEIKISAINLPKNDQIFTFTPSEEEKAIVDYATKVEEYLYEPHAALIKAGGFKSLGARYRLKKLHPNSHLYTSSEWVKDFPGRIFSVLNTYGFSKKELKNLQEIKRANITVRNFPSSVAELRKRLKLSEGGDQYIFCTTMQPSEKILIHCKKALIS